MYSGQGPIDEVRCRYVSIRRSAAARRKPILGDFLLTTIAERLGEVIRVGDFAARLGGDEFIVIQAGICEKAQADVFARRLSSALMVPIKFGENEIGATVSVGISLAPSDGTDPERLLKSADLALYKSKADGRNCIRLFDAMQARTELERTLRDARPP